MAGAGHWIRKWVGWTDQANELGKSGQARNRHRGAKPAPSRPNLDLLETRLVPAFGITQLLDDVGLVRGPVLGGMTTDDPLPLARVNLANTSAQSGDGIRILQGENPLGGDVTIQASDLTNGFIEISLPSLHSGAYQLSAKLLDGLGTVKSQSPSFAFTVDTRGPSPILQGTVFHDANRNGIREHSEGGLTQAQVRLLTEDGTTLLGQTLTGPGGVFLFDNSRLLPGAAPLTHGTVYRIEYTPPDGFGAATQTSQPGLHTVVSADSKAFLVRTVALSQDPVRVRAESAHKSTLHLEYTIDGTTRVGPLGQTNLTITGGGLSEARKLSGFSIDPLGWPGSTQGTEVFASSLGLDDRWGTRPQQIAFLQNRWGNTPLAPHEGAGLQMALLELLFDGENDLGKGRFQVAGAGPKTNPVDANAAIRAAQGYLTQAAGQAGTAVVLDTTLGGQRTAPTGGMGHLITQGFHFGALALPQFSNPAQATFTYGDDVNFQFKASGAATTFSSFDLPGTLDLAPNGRLTGWAHAGTHKFTVEATVPGFASTQQEFTLVVQPRIVRHTVENRTKIFGDVLDINPIKGETRNQAGSAFLKDPVSIENFRTRFDFMMHSYTRTIGDGLTFTIQASNPTALGTHGSGLGYQGIAKSAAIKIDLINKHTSGAQAVGLVLNGANPSQRNTRDLILDQAGISIQPGKRITMEIAYAAKRLEVTVHDNDAGLMASQSFDVDLEATLGSGQGFLGFTGGTGTLNGRFEIVSWDVDGPSGKVVDFNAGIPAHHTGIQVNGSARLRDQALILTGVDHAVEIPTGIRGETLLLRYSGNGHRSGADVGVHPILANAYDGKGRASNYTLQVTPGRLTVQPRPVTIRLPNQTQIYGQPINLNAVNPTTSNNQAGSAFWNEMVDVSRGFSTEFSFLMTPNSPGHGRAPTALADGITFTIQRRGPGALGQPAEGLGSRGIGHSVSIKFDNFNNNGEGDNSTGLFTGGANPADTGRSVNLQGTGIDFGHNRPTRVTMVYDAQKRELTVTISQTWDGTNGPEVRVATQKYTLDLAQAIGGNRAFFGFTGGTGTLVARQEVVDWRLGTIENPGAFLNFSSGPPSAAGFRFNGSGRWDSQRLVLTGSLDSASFPVGVGGETLRVLQTSPGNTNRAAVGNYTITGRAIDGTGKASNYRVTIASGNLRVNRAPLVIRARDIEAVYGSYKLNENRDFTATGLAPGDTIGSVRFYTNARMTAGGHYRVGGWHATPFNPSGGNFRSSNYNITFERGWLNILPRSLTITAPDRTKTFGETLRLTGREFRQSGLIAGDRIDRVVFSATGDIASANVGTYAIKVAKPEGLGLENYDIRFVDGTLTVLPRVIDFVVPNFQQTQGRPIQLNKIAPDPYNAAGAAWYRQKVDITHFQTRFTMVARQLDKALADGLTFTIQNQGANALGGRAGGLGYTGIGKSVAIKFDLQNNQGEGNNSTGLFVDGRNPSTAAGSINLNGSGIDLHSQNEISVDISYNGSVLKVEITDLVTGKSATQNHTIDIAKTVGGNQAWVGFTGGTGGLVAHQAIHRWNFRNRQTTVFDFPRNGWRSSDLSFAGTARFIGPGIVLTGPQYGAVVRTRVNDETLLVWFDSVGNTAGAARGTYTITGQATDGSGKLSNYELRLKPGTLTVI